jgi:hypothetical protein
MAQGIHDGARPDGRALVGRIAAAWLLAAPLVALLRTLAYDPRTTGDVAVLAAAAIAVGACHGRRGQAWIPLALAPVLWVVAARPGPQAVLGPAASVVLAIVLGIEAGRRERAGAAPREVTAVAGMATAALAVGQLLHHGTEAPAFVLLAGALIVAAAATAVGAWPLPGTRSPGGGAGVAVVPLLLADAAALSTTFVKPVLALLLAACAPLVVAVVAPTTWAAVERTFGWLRSPVDRSIDALDALLRRAGRRLGPPVRRATSVVCSPSWPALVLLPLAMIWLQVLDVDIAHPVAWVGLRTLQLGCVVALAVAAWPLLRSVIDVPDVRWSDGLRARAARAGTWAGCAPARRDPAPGGVGPLLAVGALALAVAVVQLRWIWTWRAAGNLDVDEVRFAAGSVQFARLLTFGEVGSLELWYGPVVPFLGGIATAVGSDDPRWAMSVQPLLAAATAIAATALARRIVGPIAAVVAGATVVLLPATVSATQMYLTSLGAAVAVTGAAWALLASDHGRGRTIWWFGAFVALAPLSRTMTFGLLPVLAVAAVLHASVSVRGLRRTVAALAIGAFVAAQHYLTWGWQAMGYVLGGLDDTEVQRPGVGQRLTIRFDEVADGFGHPLLLAGLALALVGAVLAWRAGARFRPLRGRPIATLGVLVVGGWSVLLTGGYFGGLGFWDLPLMPVLVVVIVALAARVPTPVPQVAGAVALAWLAYLALVATWLLPPTARGAERALGRYATAIFQPNNGPDPRISTVGRRDEIAAASEDWWATIEEVEARLRAIDAEQPGGLEVVHLGGTNYLPSAHQLLARQRDQEPIAFANATPADGWADAFVPGPTASERVLLIPELAEEATGVPGGRTPADLDAALGDDRLELSESLAEAASARGWTVDGTIDLPLGDRLLIVRAPR